MTRDWTEREFEQDGIRFRVVRGSKSPRAGNHVDRKLEWLTPIGWVPIRFLTVGIMADFLMWNEDGLYPPSHGFKGGKKLLAYLAHAYRFDVDRAEAGLKVEKEQRRLFEEAS